MSAQAASKLGIKTIIYAPGDATSPAAQVADGFIDGGYNDETKLQDFAAQVDVISYEFENIPVETVQYLKNLKPVYPDEWLLEVSQDRVAEKSFLNSIGIETTQWVEINSPENMKSVFQQWEAADVILKTTRFGYDGKGQKRVGSDDDFSYAFAELGNQTLIAEAIIDFECEISVIVARDHNKNMITYGPMLNEHLNHILHKTTVPAGLAPEIERKALNMARRIATEIDLRGVLTLELFVTKAGELLANEIAPRTHNSGHWSMDGADYSQFDNHVRAVCGLEVIEPTTQATEMINLIGDDINNLQDWEHDPQTRIHLYGKNEARTGRKMGHVNRLLKANESC